MGTFSDILGTVDGYAVLGRSAVVVETPPYRVEQVPAILSFSSSLTRAVGDRLDLDCKVS